MSGERERAELSAVQSELVEKFCDVNLRYAELRNAAGVANRERSEILGALASSGLSAYKIASLVGMSKSQIYALIGRNKWV